MPMVLRAGLRVEDPMGLAARMLGEEWSYYDGRPIGDRDRVELMDVLAPPRAARSRCRGVHIGLQRLLSRHLGARIRELVGRSGQATRRLGHTCGP